MKTCAYCGKTYPDEVLRCPIDQQLLPGEAPPSLPAEGESAIPLPPLADSLTERQMRMVEVVLVCLIAFGNSILYSGFLFFSNFPGFGSESSSYGVLKWTTYFLTEILSLTLLWYVLMRRRKSLLDLGLNWSRRDFGRSVALGLGGLLIFYSLYYAMYYTGLTRVSHAAPRNYVGGLLFNGGISFVTIFFQFLNPFFEELIARAYVITEVVYFTGSLSKAVIISTLLQASYHLYQGGPAAIANAGMFFLWSVYYARTRRIGPVILAHLYFDVVATLMYMFRHSQ